MPCIKKSKQLSVGYFDPKIEHFLSTVAVHTCIRFHVNHLETYHVIVLTVKQPSGRTDLGWRLYSPLGGGKNHVIFMKETFEG